MANYILIKKQFLISKIIIFISFLFFSFLSIADPLRRVVQIPCGINSWSISVFGQKGKPNVQVSLKFIGVQTSSGKKLPIIHDGYSDPYVQYLGVNRPVRLLVFDSLSIAYGGAMLNVGEKINLRKGRGFKAMMLSPNCSEPGELEVVLEITESVIDDKEHQAIVKKIDRSYEIGQKVFEKEKQLGNLELDGSSDDVKQLIELGEKVYERYLRKPVMFKKVDIVFPYVAGTKCDEWFCRKRRIEWAIENLKSMEVFTELELGLKDQQLICDDIEKISDDLLEKLAGYAWLAGVWCGINYDQSKKDLIMPDISDTDSKEVYAWWDEKGRQQLVDNWSSDDQLIFDELVKIGSDTVTSLVEDSTHAMIADCVDQGYKYGKEEPEKVLDLVDCNIKNEISVARPVTFYELWDGDLGADEGERNKIIQALGLDDDSKISVFNQIDEKLYWRTIRLRTNQVAEFSQVFDKAVNKYGSRLRTLFFPTVTWISPGF